MKRYLQIFNKQNLNKIKIDVIPTKKCINKKKQVPRKNMKLPTQGLNLYIIGTYINIGLFYGMNDLSNRKTATRKKLFSVVLEC